MKPRMPVREPLSPEVKAALRRSREENVRWLHGIIIEGYEKHLRECGKTRCQECKDARVLIPHYRGLMLQELKRIASEG
ncbi:MAG: hypothetical protein HZB91_06430 [Elusimicrobia bacterium]|nr:hypothetical protein [Elusimicrobiota bacterium]